MVVAHPLLAGVSRCGPAEATSSTHAFTAWLAHGVVGESPGALRATSSEQPRTQAEADEQLRWLARSAPAGAREERAEEPVSTAAETANMTTMATATIPLTSRW